MIQKAIWKPWPSRNRGIFPARKWVDLSSSLCGSLPGRVHFWWSFLLLVTLYGYGSIPGHTIFRGVNIHLPAILMFTRGTRFWHTAIWVTGWLWIFHSPRGRDHAMLTCLPTACSEAVLSQWLAPTFIHSGTLEGARCEREHPWSAGPKMLILDGKIRYNPSIWLVVGSWHMNGLWLSIQLGMSSSISSHLTKSYFSEGLVGIPPTSMSLSNPFLVNGLIIGFSNTALWGILNHHWRLDPVYPTEALSDCRRAIWITPVAGMEFSLGLGWVSLEVEWRREREVQIEKETSRRDGEIER